MKLKDSGEVYDLEMIGQSGIYATFIPNKESIDYVLDGKYETLYVFYVDDLLVIQVGFSDEGPKFIAYK